MRISSNPGHGSFLVLIQLFFKASATSYNGEFMASVVSNVRLSMTVPYTRMLNPMVVGFKSEWSYVYGGEANARADGGRVILDQLDNNATLSFFWALFSSLTVDPSSNEAGRNHADALYGMYGGFKNGKFLSYKQGPTSGDPTYTLVYVDDANSSCPDWNIFKECRLSFQGTTDVVTGKSNGPPSTAISYSPSTRPWYLGSASDWEAGGSGSVWSMPYHFVSETGEEELGPLGITATSTISNADTQFLGVFGVDYTFSQIEADLIAQVKEPEIYTIYITDSAGFMIASSIANISLDETTGTQVLSSASLNTVVSVTSTFLMTQAQGGGWVAASGNIFLVEVSGTLYWLVPNRLTDTHGLDWNIVVVQKVLCEVGFLASWKNGEATDDVCKKCPSGGKCLGGAAPAFNKDGYWSNGENVFYQCQTNAGTTCEANFKCAAGFTGRECSIPEDNYFLFGPFTMKCGSTPGAEVWNLIWPYATLLLFTFGTKYLVNQFSSLAVLLDSLQNVALVLNFDFNWPPTHALRLFMSFVLFGFDSVFPTCTNDTWNWIKGAYVLWSIPLLIYPAVMFLMSHFRSLPNAKHAAIGESLLFLDLSFVAIVQTAFMALNCREELNEKYYMYAAPNVECYTPTHLTVYVFALFVIILIGVGYPLTLGIVIWRFRQSGHQPSDSFFEKFGYSFEAFHYRANRWHCLQLFRSLLLCLIANVGNLGAARQGILGLLLNVGYLAAVVHSQPFIFSAINVADAFLVCCEMSIIWFGFAFDAYPDDTRVTEYGMIVVLCLVYGGILLGVGVNELCDFFYRQYSLLKLQEIEHWMLNGHTNYSHTNKMFSGAIYGLNAVAVPAISTLPTKEGVKEEEIGLNEDIVTTLNPSSFAKWLRKQSKDASADPQGEAADLMKNFLGFSDHIDQGGYLKRTHALSMYSPDHFWQDLVDTFPMFVDWTLHSLKSSTTSSFEADRSEILSVFDKLHKYNKLQGLKQTLSSQIRQSEWAPILNFLLVEATQSDVDILFSMLDDMSQKKTRIDFDFSWKSPSAESKPSDVTEHMGLENGKVVLMERSCPCSNQYKEDSIFCRKCGRRRQKLEPQSLKRAVQLVERLDEASLFELLSGRDGPEMQQRGSTEMMVMVVSNQLSLSQEIYKPRALEVIDHVGLVNGERLPMERMCPCGNAFKEDTIFCRRCGARRKSQKETTNIAHQKIAAAELVKKTEHELEALVRMEVSTAALAAASDKTGAARSILSARMKRMSRIRFSQTDNTGVSHIQENSEDPLEVEMAPYGSAQNPLASLEWGNADDIQKGNPGSSHV